MKRNEIEEFREYNECGKMIHSRELLWEKWCEWESYPCQKSGGSRGAVWEGNKFPCRKCSV